MWLAEQGAGCDWEIRVRGVVGRSGYRVLLGDQGAGCCWETGVRYVIGRSGFGLLLGDQGAGYGWEIRSDALRGCRFFAAISDMSLVLLLYNHLRQTMKDTRNRTAETLEKMFALPQEEHQGVIDSFIGRLDQFFQGSDQHPPEEIVVKLFADLFPFVYHHVLTGPASAAARATSGGGDHSQGKLEPAAQDCLRQEFAKVQPFGTLPTVLGKRMKYALQRARAYTETLDVLLTAINMANSGATVHKSCSRAVSRLRFCSMCPGEQQTRACRGLCLNVMRGCLSKVAEVSSAWDELIIAFENLNMGVRSRHDAQEMLAGLGANVTGAVVDAFNQKQRIHNEVMSACRQSSPSMSNRAPRSSLAIPGERQPSGTSLKSLSPSEDHFTRQKSMRTDLETLITVLEDSKGFLLQLPDSLCRMPVLYDMEMDSDRCWNGSAVGR
ncbi:gpc3/5 [Plakobranchus ocellatus]|uniref:Gpc3/5 n=1 Tax=Plakobranchus ocellatus TaxID=259542 RepID=A0AAV4BDP4_9GAST|nr:gpc3/5 [Plakobranchus ocellatus]